MTAPERDEDAEWFGARSDDDSDAGWGEESSATEELKRRMQWFDEQRPPHASE